MTDPLSVSASIAGLVTLADIILRRTYKYVKAVKKASKEISALSAEIGALYGILSNLQLVSRQLENEIFESTTRAHHIYSCYQTLEDVRSILNKDDASSLQDQRLETLRRKLRWPFTSSEVKILIADIERHKTALGLALNVDCMSGLLQALSRQDEIQDTVAGLRLDLKERHEAETCVADNKERQKILKSFLKVDSRSYHHMSLKLRSPGTGLWLTEGQEFRQWLETKNAKLWLYGIPGAGKTVLASSVIEKALETSSPSTAVAFFYCDYKDPATQDLTNILASLAQQFAKQDEDSFDKLRNFCATHNPEHRPNFAYDSKDLWSLLMAMTSAFDCAMIIVDALDECGTNVHRVVDSLTSLQDREETTVSLLFLSRDEIEIRQRLEDYAKVSIAARTIDLSLYVGAEIELRIRKKRLRIKDQSLKEHILERLVGGAEGMFRWVTCQMDYLCELPNDAARRMALGSLPPDLNSTYERILRRVNQSNSETQKLVRRALRWIAYNDGEPDFTIEALCEAVSIDLGSTRRNSQAIPDDYDILHWCSSLVRKSADGKRLELAHFTVQEFLEQIDPSQDITISAYRMDAASDELILAKVCLTYLSFEDFNLNDPFSQHAVERRIYEYPFRQYAVDGWNDVASHSLANEDLFSLGSYGILSVWSLEDEKNLSMIKTGIAEATALHYAAMTHLAQACSWLIKSGCDVNRNTNFGTPLHCAILGEVCLIGKFEDPLSYSDQDTGDTKFNETANDTVDLLLEAGADPNCCYDAGTSKLSPLFMTLSTGQWNLALRLLDRGGILDTNCLDALEIHLDSEDVRKIVEHTSKHNLLSGNQDRLLQLALRAKTSNATSLMQKGTDLTYQNAHYEHLLRTAAEFGQVEIVARLLNDHKLDVNAADESTGLTALHHAARTDQLVVAQTLVDQGADLSISDLLGRNALQYSVQGREVHCLEFFLQRGADTNFQDLQGMTVWHRAAQQGNSQALTILLGLPVDAASAIGLKANDGRTPLLYASASGSKEAIRLLLSAGSRLTETALDGSSSIHHTAKSGSSEGVEFLIGHGADVKAVTHDDSSVLHYAVSGDSGNLAKIVQILIENGVDPCQARNDGCTPFHDLLKLIKKNSTSSEQLDYLFAASRTLLKTLLEISRLRSDAQLGSEVLNLACTYWFPSAHDTVLALLELGVDCNVPSANGETALMAAAESGNVAISSSLLLYGADACINDSGLNAVHYACYNDHTDILVCLRETAIDWNGKAMVETLGVRRKNVTALHIAAVADNGRTLEYLLNENLMSNINALNDHGETPLIEAVCAQKPRNVSLLVSNGADTTVLDTFGDGATHIAAQNGDEKVISEFIRHGSDLGLPNKFGLTPELVARKNGHKTLADTIMDYVNEQVDKHNSNLPSQRLGKTSGTSEALKVAMDIGDLELCKRLVENGTDLGSGIEGDLTAFHYAAAVGSVDLLRFLLDKCPSEVYGSHNAIHLIHHAVFNGNIECVKLILDHASQGMNSFSCCFPQDGDEKTNTAKGRVYSDQLGTLQEAVDRMVNMQVRGDMLRWHWHAGPGESFPRVLATAMPLHIAASRGDLHVAKVLLENGASVDGVNNTHSTPLHFAAAVGQMAMIELLLEFGANPNAVDTELMSPCMVAARGDWVDATQALMMGGADIQLRNGRGQSTLRIAVISGAQGVFALLMNTALYHDLGSEDLFGGSILYEAVCRRSNFPMTFLLNLTPPPGVYESRVDNILIAAIGNRSMADFRMLLRRLPTGCLPRLLDYRAQAWGTPLYTAVLQSSVDHIKLLLDAGAQLEVEGSEHGTPLMAACATGRLACVKVLVARGARTSYVKDGQKYSALLAAKHHPQVRRWLLVGRFVEGPKLLTYYKQVE